MRGDEKVHFSMQLSNVFWRLIIKNHDAVSYCPLITQGRFFYQDLHDLNIDLLRNIAFHAHPEAPPFVVMRPDSMPHEVVEKLFQGLFIAPAPSIAQRRRRAQQINSMKDQIVARLQGLLPPSSHDCPRPNALFCLGQHIQVAFWRDHNIMMLAKYLDLVPSTEYGVPDFGLARKLVQGMLV